jgi:peptidyl-prolyl cis-trans isomerase SurA
MKFLKPFIACLLIIMLTTSQAGGVITDRIIAVVNDEIITQQELSAALAPFLKNIEKSQQPGDAGKVMIEARRTILDNMIFEALMRQDARRLGIAVRDEEVMAAIKDNLKRRNIQLDDFMEVLTREGMSLEKYKDGMKSELIKSKIIQREIRPTIAISNEEIGNYYREHRQDYEGKEKVRLQQILLVIPENSSPEAKEQIRENAKNILKRLKDGESFEMLAGQYSQGPAAKAGGDVGFVERGVIFPAVDEVAFRLKAGEISDLIESPLGFHIIKVAEKRGSGSTSLAAVREEIEDKIFRDKTEKKFIEYMENLRKKAYVEIRLDKE